VLVALALLAADTWVNARRFKPAWWRRLALIAGMAAVGALFFRLLKLLWAWHGLWHIYHVGACYLLLVAQRTKQAAAARTALAGGSAVSRGATASHSAEAGLAHRGKLVGDALHANADEGGAARLAGGDNGSSAEV